MRGSFRLLASLLLLAACDRTPEATGTVQQSAPKATVSAAPIALAPIPPAAPLRIKAPGRIVAIGDLHGDLASAREALKLSGALGPDDHWAGGDLTLVQLGDQLDRGDHEREILDLFERLSSEAGRAGGQVVVLNGNHELMNVAGDLRYVTPGGYAAFREFAAQARPAPGVAESARGRVAAFAPDGPYARKLAGRGVVVIVNDNVFVHGGVLTKHVRYGLERINGEVRRWMLAELPAPPPAIQAEDSLVWTRLYGDPEPSEAACAEADAVLKELQIKRMVVAHTPQKHGVSSACGGKVFRVDVGLADYYGMNATQVLAIDGERISVLDATR